MPQLNIKANTDAVQVISKGPQSLAPTDYICDAFNDNQVQWNSLVPTGTGVIAQLNLMVTCGFLIGYSVRGDETDFPDGGLPFLSGAKLSDYLKCPNTRNAAPANSPFAFDAARATTDGSWPRPPTTYAGDGDNCLLAMRALPVNSICNNIGLTINGNSTTIQGAEYADLWPYLTKAGDNGKYLSTTPFYRSKGTTLPSLTVLQPWTVDSQTGVDMYQGRLPPQFSNVSVRPVAYANDANPSTGFSIIYEVIVQEAIIIPPYAFGETYKAAGMTRVVSMALSYQTQYLKTRLLVINSKLGQYAAMPGAAEPAIFGLQITTGGAGNTMTVPGFNTGAAIPAITYTSTKTQPKLQILYAQPDPVTLKGEPPSALYECDLHQQWTSSIQETAAFTAWASYTDQKWTATSQALRLPNIPSLIYIYAKPSLTARALNIDRASGAAPNAINMADSYMNIEWVSINFMDRVALLSTYDEVGLYRMSVKNGYQGSFYEWHNTAGSVVIVDVVEDLCLAPTEAPGQASYSTIQIQVRGTYAVQEWTAINNLGYTDTSLGSHTQNNIQHSLYVTTEIPGKCLVGGGQAQFVTEGPQPAQMFALMNRTGPPHTRASVSPADDAVKGGGFRSSNLSANKSIYPSSSGSLGLSSMAPAITHQVLDSIMQHVAPPTSSVSGGAFGFLAGGNKYAKVHPTPPPAFGAPPPPVPHLPAALAPRPGPHGAAADTDSIGDRMMSDDDDDDRSIRGDG